jgi:cytochrome c oxidase subunit III
LANFSIDPVVNAKAKKNLLKWGIFSICMMFAGFTSAYLVSRGSQFWVVFQMPKEFIYSTAVIVISSICLIIALRLVRRNKNGAATGLIGLALVLGVFFGYYQVKGWSYLISRGNRAVGMVINQEGRYGAHYSLMYQGKEINYDNGLYLYEGQEMTPELKAKMVEFCKEVEAGYLPPRNTSGIYKLTGYGTDWVLKNEGQLVTYANDKLAVNGLELSNVQKDRLYRFSESIVNGRGDFIMTGKYGEDFTIYYKGTPLEYKNRKFTLNGKKLSAKQESDLNGSDNKSSSYLYIFTGMHLLHWIGGIIALLVLFIRSARHQYSAQNTLGIELGSTYWHFLAILWIYLYAFLVFIH